MKLKFIQNIKKDVRNWQEAIIAESYGLKWKDYIPDALSIGCIKNEKCITDYLKNKYYNSGEIILYIKALQNKLNTSEIKKDLEFLVGKKFPNKIISVFITTFPRSPYSVANNFFYLRYRSQEKGIEKSITNIYHELMHFLFHWHYWNKCISYGLDDKQIHILKESLTVLLNPILKKRKLPLDKGYKDHQLLRKRIVRFWQEKQDFNFVLERIIEDSFLKKKSHG